MIAAVVLAALPSSAFGATVSADMNGHVAYSAASGELNQVQLSVTGAAPGPFTVAITDTGAVITAGVGCVQVSDHEVTCSEAIRADFDLGDLDDTSSLVLEESNGVGVSFSGGGGKDTLTLCSLCDGILFGSSGADTLQGGDLGAGLGGGEGPDSLTGGAYIDNIRGGPGNDTIHAGGDEDWIRPGLGNDLVQGGPGLDRLSFNAKGPRVVVDLRLGTAKGQGAKTLTKIEKIIATNRADKLYGDDGADTFNGLAGDDLVVGRGGDDELCGCGGPGSDRLFGGRGRDDLAGWRGPDYLVGGPGGDFLWPGDGHDAVFARGGDDDFHARDGVRDLLYGGRGTDLGRIDRRLDLTRSIVGVPFL